MAARAVTSIDDDDLVRVTTWTFDAGDSTGLHVHDREYLMAPVTGGTFLVTGPDGATGHQTQQAGTPYRGSAGTMHDVRSTGAAPAVFIEIELKSGDELNGERDLRTAPDTP